MKNKFPAFTTSLIGSMPRSSSLINAQVAYSQRKIKEDQFNQIVFNETQKIVQMQQDAGIDVIVDGELTRDNYMSFVANKVSGIELKSLKEISELIEDKINFEKSIEDMDADNNYMNNPVVTQKIDVNASLETQEISRLKKMTNHPIKATIPSPYLLTRSMWIEDISGKVYEDRHDLGKDVVQLLINEVKRLINMGVDVIQIDDPILSDVVFNIKNKSDSFY